VMKHYELDVHNAKTLARIARETSAESPVLQARGATAGGDERKLRGIPAIGRGVSGVIPGTSPHAIRSER
jgi:hypothetical protein